jgi:hypothetical protein
MTASTGITRAELGRERLEQVVGEVFDIVDP